MKKILLIIGIITLFCSCQKDFSVWKEYNDAELKNYEANLGKTLPVDTFWVSKSGLLVEVFHWGQTSIMPKLSSLVFCNQSGKLVDDTSFQSLDLRSYYVGDNPVKGLQEILCQMPQGSHFKIYVPYELAYGKNGQKSINTFYIPPYSVLIFDIEIVEVYQNTP